MIDKPSPRRNGWCPQSFEVSNSAVLIVAVAAYLVVAEICYTLRTLPSTNDARELAQLRQAVAQYAQSRP